MENNADKRTNHQVQNYSLSPILKIFMMAHSLSGSENLQREHEPHSRRRPAPPPEVCSLAGRLLWLTRRPQSLLLLKNMKTRCILKAPEYTGRLLVLLRLAYPSNIFFRCTTTNKGRREPALGYPRSEYDWAGRHGGWRIMRWPVQRRWESSGFHLYVMGGWSLLSPSYV